VVAANALEAVGGEVSAEGSPTVIDQSKFGKVLIEEELLPCSHVRLTVTVEAPYCKSAYDAAVKELSNAVSIPGFRKGKKARVDTGADTCV
jgi:Bacterial trigger factor protein (TF)